MSLVLSQVTWKPPPTKAPTMKAQEFEGDILFYSYPHKTPLLTWGPPALTPLGMFKVVHLRIPCSGPGHHRHVQYFFTLRPPAPPFPFLPGMNCYHSVRLDRNKELSF